MLCERLEKKIAGLSKLGGQLQHENKSRTLINVLRAKLRINVQKKLAQKRVILSLTIILHR